MTLKEQYKKNTEGFSPYGGGDSHGWWRVTANVGQWSCCFPFIFNQTRCRPAPATEAAPSSTSGFMVAKHGGCQSRVSAIWQQCNTANYTTQRHPVGRATLPLLLAHHRIWRECDKCDCSAWTRWADDSPFASAFRTLFMGSLPDGYVTNPK